MEEQFGNHTEGTEVNTQQEVQMQQTQQPSQPEEETKYFEVKYNKEPVKVSYEEAPQYIQKGMNYDKVQQRVTEYEEKLNEIARITGYRTTDELFQALEQAKKQEQEQMYRQAGIDPETFNQLLENHPDIQFAREMKQKQEEDQRFQQEANELFEAFPEIKAEDIQPDVWRIREERGISLLDAYLRINFKNLGQQKEQEAIQKLQGNANASPGSLGGGDVNHTTSIKDMSKQDFENLVERVKRGENVQI